MNKQTKSCVILLDNLLFGTKKYSRKDFIAKLKEENLSYSNSSVTRILNVIYFDFGIRIQHNNNFYEIIDNETEPDFLDKYKNIKNLLFREIIHKNIIENSLVSQFISIGNDTANIGIEYIENVLNAILEKRKLKISYQAFYESEMNEYVANPIFIKEYQNRWYLISEQNDNENFKIFAFDRIKNLVVLNELFKQKKLNHDFFKNTIGINYSEIVEQVILSFNAWQGNYIKTLPLHSSQKIITDNENTLTVAINVNINFELEQLIKSYGSSVKIIEPQWFKVKVIDDFKKSLQLYEK